MATPAEQLLGMTLEGGWKVIEIVVPAPSATGGNFSHGYIVENDQRVRAFLKALDYARALKAPDPAKALQALTEGFNFERRVLERCRAKRLDRVVMAITDGNIQVSGEPVQYLILELAEGDARAQVDGADRFDIAWMLRSLHHISTGISQLHRERIAHQDVKPSNILFFEGGKLSKLGDLGRAAYFGHTPPHDVFQIAGDPSYAPPELLYGQVDPDWNRRHYGCDAYLLCSMAVFFFSGVGMTALLRRELHPLHAWDRWRAGFGSALPYVRDAFGRAVDYIRTQLPDGLKDEMTTAIRELCEPDPSLRGHPFNRAGRTDQYSLERYISRFNLLARRAELGLLKK
jgi:serine/threonine protein kinase